MQKNIYLHIKISIFTIFSFSPKPGGGHIGFPWFQDFPPRGSLRTFFLSLRTYPGIKICWVCFCCNLWEVDQIFLLKCLNYWWVERFGRRQREVEYHGQCKAEAWCHQTSPLIKGRGEEDQEPFIILNISIISPRNGLLYNVWSPGSFSHSS